MTFCAKRFSELSNVELYEILRARCGIFTVEQGIICQDMDRADYDALHCMLTENSELVAYLRAFRVDDTSVKIGRVLTLEHGKGLGKILMNDSLEAIKSFYGCDVIKVSAQTQAQGFYARFGFVTVSDVYMEENVPHVAMEKRLGLSD